MELAPRPAAPPPALDLLAGGRQGDAWSEFLQRMLPSAERPDEPKSPPPRAPRNASGAAVAAE